MDAIFAPLGLTAPQFSILNLLAGNAPIRISDLADLSGTDRTTMTRNIGILMRLKLVKHVAEEDKRARALDITKTGNARLREALPLWEAQQKRTVSRLSQTDSEILLRILSTI